MSVADLPFARNMRARPARLSALRVAGFLLADRVDVSFNDGLTALTGETGAGKSILLDALALVLGGRGDAAQVRDGADAATFTAVFDTHPDHPVQTLLHDLDIAAEDTLILRRVLGHDGRSRAFVNDRPVSLGALKTLGEQLVDIHGQFDTLGLLRDECARDLLDRFGGHGPLLESVARAHTDLTAARAALQAAESEVDAASRDIDYLDHVIAELRDAAPEPGEEQTLLDARRRAQHFAQVQTAYNDAHELLDGAEGSRMALHRAARLLERLGEKADQKVETNALPDINAALDAIARAADTLSDLMRDADGPPLETIDDRLHLIRSLARKHGVQADDLPQTLTGFETRRAAIRTTTDALPTLRVALDTAQKTYDAVAGQLTAARLKSASALQSAVMDELKHLKLDKAQFFVGIESSGARGSDGADTVRFNAATNPGMPAGPIAKIASGGELSRFMLALKMVLAADAPVGTLVFDEIDAGMGGATAAAIGDRLQALSATVPQVLVVTHAAQVAARAGDHWRVAKHTQEGKTFVTLTPLTSVQARTDELARMLAGHTITDEARRAAQSLLDESVRDARPLDNSPPVRVKSTRP